MGNISIEISKIKNVKKASIELPIKKGVYAIVGTNGCGKSTLLQVLAQCISKHYLGQLKSEDYSPDSYVEFTYEGFVNHWKYSNNWWNVDNPHEIIQINGMYEGSLFYGTRFHDSSIVDEHLRNGKIGNSEIVDSDDYVKQTLSFILHGDRDHYKNLKRIRNKSISQNLGLKSTPYFNVVDENLISQYRMSSGECLLISLLHFIYNAIIRSSLPRNRPILVLIDEIELALHPIAVSRLLDLLNEILERADTLVVFLTTHSPEVIRKISPINLFKMENVSGEINIVNPCYPSYVIRDVYRHDGFDYLLLVEDALAKCVVEKVLLKYSLTNSKLVHTVPVGGWTNVLTLHKDLLTGNILGIGRYVISILDGDIENLVGKDFSDLRKLFLPIKSIEKFLYDILVNKKIPALKKIINDKYFQIKSIDTILSEFHQRFNSQSKNPDKKLYDMILSDLDSRKIQEHTFVISLCDEIMNVVDFNKFSESLKKLLEKTK